MPKHEHDAINHAIKAVARAARTLDPAQGRIARRNARARVAAAIRSLRAVVDKEFPAPPRLATKQPSRSGTIAQRQARARARMARDGHVEVIADSLIRACATVGIRLRQPASGGYFVPRWVRAVWDLPPADYIGKVRRLTEIRRGGTAAKRAVCAEHALASVNVVRPE